MPFIEYSTEKCKTEAALGGPLALVLMGLTETGCHHPAPEGGPCHALPLQQECQGSKLQVCFPLNACLFRIVAKAEDSESNHHQSGAICTSTSGPAPRKPSGKLKGTYIKV